MMLTKAKPVGPKPVEGDYRVTEHFTWWPKKVKEGVIMLERYKRIEEWRVRRRMHFIGGFCFTVTAGGWDIIEEKRIGR